MTQSSVVWLPKALRDEMIAHALEDYPREACGIVAKQGGKPVRVRRMRNVHENPTMRYTVDAKELMDVDRELEARNEELLGIYHSHPKTEPYPSPTDVRLAAWPDVVYFLMSLRDRENPELRAYLIDQSGDPEEREYSDPMTEEDRRRYHARISELQVVIVD